MPSEEFKCICKTITIDNYGCNNLVKEYCNKKYNNNLSICYEDFYQGCNLNPLGVILGCGTLDEVRYINNTIPDIQNINKLTITRSFDHQFRKDQSDIERIPICKLLFEINPLITLYDAMAIFNYPMTQTEIDFHKYILHKSLLALSESIKNETDPFMEHRLEFYFHMYQSPNSNIIKFIFNTLINYKIINKNIIRKFFLNLCNQKDTANNYSIIIKKLIENIHGCSIITMINPHYVKKCILIDYV